MLKKYINENKYIVVNEILNICKDFSGHQKEILRELIEYNVLDGKMSRCYLTFETILMYRSSVDFKEEALKFSMLNELLQASFLVFDDIMDNSEYRRNKKCWHLKKGKLALKDGYLILSLCRKYLEYNCQGKNIKCFKLLEDVIFKTSLGQTMDVLLSNFKSIINVQERYSMSNYENICYNKNAYYTFYFPIKLGFLVAGVDEPESLEFFTNICGYVHQMQDDYLNFMPNISNKTSCDLKEKKSTWFICKLVETLGHENDIILNYLNTGEESEIMKKIVDLYPKFFKEKEMLINNLAKISESENIKIYDLCTKILRK